MALGIEPGTKNMWIKGVATELHHQSIPTLQIILLQKAEKIQIRIIPDTQAPVQKYKKGWKSRGDDPFKKYQLHKNEFQ